MEIQKSRLDDYVDSGGKYQTSSNKPNGLAITNGWQDTGFPSRVVGFTFGDRRRQCRVSASTAVAAEGMQTVGRAGLERPGSRAR